MLQIASGKLFAQDPVRYNDLRGILSSNMLILQNKAIETKAGRILPTSSISKNNGGLVYEFREYMEQNPAPGVLVSSGIEPYIYDFATIVSLGLNVTCTDSAEETHRLTTGKQGAKFGLLASSFIPRVFDRQIIITDTEISQFVDFVENLIDLERKYFLRAIRAIRTSLHYTDSLMT